MLSGSPTFCAGPSDGRRAKAALAAADDKHRNPPRTHGRGVAGRRPLRRVERLPDQSGGGNDGGGSGPIGYWLKHLDGLIGGNFERTLAGEGVTRRRWQALDALHERAVHPG